MFWDKGLKLDHIRSTWKLVVTIMKQCFNIFMRIVAVFAASGFRINTPESISTIEAFVKFSAMTANCLISKEYRKILKRSFVE